MTNAYFIKLVLLACVMTITCIIILTLSLNLIAGVVVFVFTLAAAIMTFLFGFECGKDRPSGFIDVTQLQDGVWLTRRKSRGFWVVESLESSSIELVTSKTSLPSFQTFEVRSGKVLLADHAVPEKQ